MTRDTTGEDPAPWTTRPGTGHHWALTRSAAQIRSPERRALASSVDPRLTQVPVVLQFASAVEDLVLGVYVGGSVATGDYQHGVSDIDAVALVEHVPTAPMRRALVAVHERLVRDVAEGEALHCVYVPRLDGEEPARKHWTWAFGELFRRPLSGIARAELLADPVVACGPPPSSWLPSMDAQAIQQAAREELAGYWTRALRKRRIWREDVYVDVGLTTIARAGVTIREGRLVTKAEAIGRLPDLGVPPCVAEGVARRRRGEEVPLDEQQRRERAILVRRLIQQEIERLLD
jgi:hypothetical protein